MTADAAKSADIPLCVCGEMAANNHYAALLLGLGVRELSMPVTNVPMVKERIRSLRISEMEEFAGRILSLSFPEDVENALNEFENRR